MKPIDIDTLWELQRAGSVAISPDGSAAVCTLATPSMEENKSSTSIWLLPCDGSGARRLTHGDKDSQPAWSPGGDRVAFLAKREQDGQKDAHGQLYVIPAHGGEAERRSDFAPGVQAFRWFPDGKRIAFVAWVWPELKGARAQAARFGQFSERKESAYVTSEALYRHFDSNLPMGRVPHLLVLDVASGRIRDLFEGTAFELPRIEPGLAHFDISPDGRRVAFAHDPSPRKSPIGTLAIAEMDLATHRVRPLTADRGWTYEAPRYAPDGLRLACTASHVGRRHTSPARLAFIVPGRGVRVVGDDWPVDVELPRWSADGAAVLFTAQQRGRCHLWRYDVAGNSLSIALQGGWVQGFDVAGTGAAETIVVAIDSARHPVQVHALRAGVARRLETFNDARMAAIAIGETREVTLRGAQGDPVQMFVTFPPRFDPKRRYPVLHVIHGGPYAAAGDTFAYRWNTHLFASRGFVVAAVNYHGSSGFGLRFADSIIGRMGKLELQDVEAATDWLLAQRWADRARVYASGGSYGGYLVAWMNGHVAPGRYRAYVCHAGVFDRVATFSADSFLHRARDMGALYWENPARVRAQSPVTYAGRMRTPTLVLHGNNDYRVPDANGLAYYNTLVARGVPARLVWFPDENHWILKPRNSRLWYREFFDWLAAHGAHARNASRGGAKIERGVTPAGKPSTA